MHAFNNKVFCMNCNRVFCKCGKKQDSGYGYLCCKDKNDKWSNCDNKKYLRYAKRRIKTYKVRSFFVFTRQKLRRLLKIILRPFLSKKEK